MDKKSHLFGLLISIVVAGVASGVWVPLTGEPVPISSLPGGILVVGDKEFSEFDVFGLGIGVPQPDADSVLVQGGQNDATGDYGLRLVLDWDVGSNQGINANISFKAVILPQYPEYFFNDVSMILSGASATSTGVINASESVWDAPIPVGNLLASLSCSKQYDDGDVYLQDHAEFALVKDIWVRKDISITGGTGGNAHLDETFQFYSQIPEPATVLLLGLGSLVLLRKRPWV